MTYSARRGFPFGLGCSIAFTLALASAGPGAATFLVTLVAICLGTAPAIAETAPPDEIARPLTAEQLLVFEAQVPGSEPASRTGYSVALSGDGRTALVGAPHEVDCGQGWRCGAVHVLVRRGATWVEQARLLASDRLRGELGTSVALSYDGSIALIGAPWGDFPGGAHYGAAYVFVRHGESWSEAQKLSASDRQYADFFGWSVDLSLDGSIALIGSTHASCGQVPTCGAAYVFDRTGETWIETARLAQPNPVGTENFGRSVSLSNDGTVALVGSPYGFTGGHYSGEAFVFVHSGAIWTLEQRFTSSDAQSWDEVGTSVSLSGDGSTALVGTRAYCALGSECGAAYVFARNGGQWTESAKFTVPAVIGTWSFGQAVALSGDARHALVGGAISCQFEETCRVAYLWAEEGGVWRQKQELTAPRRCSGGLFGWSMSLSENADQAIAGVEDLSCSSDPGEADLFGRGFVPAPQEIPAARGAGLAVLAIALAAIGAAMLRR